ncbi:AAA family ATPase [candidate division KSB1 bacterium]|nr:AAA family ATPase [candidate division KSB1 bacterium]
MKLLEMTLNGFGRLREAQFKFHPKINVIFGPNEAGKSTLQQAIIALLYGFYDNSRALQKDQEMHERYRPWLLRRSARAAKMGLIDSPQTGALRIQPAMARAAEHEAAMSVLPAETAAVAVVSEPRIVFAAQSATAAYKPTPAEESADKPAAANGSRASLKSDYGGSLKYALDDGHAFLIHRDFGNDDVPTQLLDAVTGEDWLVRYRRGPALRGKADFMEKQIGMSRQVFLATACLQQGALRPLADRDATAVSDAILRLLDAAGADHSAEQAIERLEKKLRELGSDRSQKALLPQARLQLEELRATQLLRLATQREAQNDMEKIEFIELELDELRAQIDGLDRQIIQNQLAQLEARLSRAQESEQQREKLAAEIAAALPYKNFPVEEKELFFQLMHDFNHEDKLRSLLADERAGLDVKLLALAGKSETLHVPEDLWQEFLFEEFLALRSRWEAVSEEILNNESAEHDIEESVKKAGLTEIDRAALAGLDWRQLEQHKTLEARVKEEEAEVEEARAAYDEHQKDRERRQGVAALGAVIAIVALVMDLGNRLISSDSNALGFILPTCIIALLVVVALYVRWGTRSRELGQWLLEVEDRYMEDRQQWREVLSSYGVRSIEELEKRRVEYDELSGVIQKRQKFKDEMNKIEQPLAVWMAKLGIGYIGIETLRDAEQRLRQSHEVWSEKNTVQQRLAQIDDKQKQIAIVLSRISNELEEILQKAGIDEPAGEEAFQSYLSGCQKREYLESRQMQLQQTEALRAEILAGDTPETLAATIARLREELQPFDSASAPLPAAANNEDGAIKLPPSPVTEVTRTELQKKREKVLEEIHAREQNLAVLRERVEARLQGLPPLAEIEEDIALVEAEVNSLENARQALELARDYISHAAQTLHHNFAPRLNEFLGRHLEKLTGGRYVDAMVDPADFSVRLQGPAVPAPVALTKLSLGTIEQVYLLLRAAVVEFFAESGESIPLLLDDPLVHADARRMANALQILDILAESHQIFYFTKDPLVFEHFHGKPEQCAIIALEGR